MKDLIAAMLLMTMTMLAGCGGGGAAAPAPAPVAPTKAVLTLSVAGTLPADTKIGMVGVTIELPAGVSAGSPDPVTASSSVSSPYEIALYTAASGSNPATLMVAVGTNVDPGFSTGTFATVVCDLNGTSPAATAFQFAGGTFSAAGIVSSVSGTSTTSLTGALTPSMSVVFQ